MIRSAVRTAVATLQDPVQGAQQAADSAMARGASWIQELTNLSPETQWDIVVSSLLVLIVMAARALALRIMRARIEDVRTRYRWRKTITYVSVVIGFLLVGRVWSEGIGELATFFGLLSAGLAIALKDPIVNLGGWLFIIWRRPFVVGDRVQVGPNAGDVIDQRIFQFIILEIGNWVDADQSTGRIVHVPNGLVFREPLANYTRGMQYIWNEIGVLVTFESAWRKAKEILDEIVQEHAREVVEEARQQMQKASRQFMIFYSNLTPIVYTEVKDSGVLLTVRYLCHPRRRRSTTQAIWEDVLERFAEHDDIDFAYPTTRYYYNAVEGKPGTLPPQDRGTDGPVPS
ncbi:MAG: mechanosensitive ion channel family protein [Longimicrobiales bacterium]|nr:mechanosensitive ion channel family protein [Longimicrobiales bacterium]